MSGRRPSEEHDAPITRESIDQAIKQAIEAALASHRPKTDVKVIMAIAISFAGLLITMLGGLISFSNHIAIIQERQQVNSALILRLAERIDANEAFLHNDESAISQTAQELHDHKEIDNERWSRAGGKREKQ